MDLIAEATSYSGLARNNAVEVLCHATADYAVAGSSAIKRDISSSYGNTAGEPLAATKYALWANAFFLTFAAPEHALRCAACIQRRLASPFPAIRAILV